MPIASAKSKVEISLFSIINRTTFSLVFSLVFSEPFSGIFVAEFSVICPSIGIIISNTSPSLNAGKAPGL
jgi:hypothetical protein